MKKYKHLNTVTISADALRANHDALQSFHQEARVCPVLKSNAYGHGLKETVSLFDSLNAPFLVVDSLPEAYELHTYVVKTPILVMGYTDPVNLIGESLPFDFAVFDLEVAKTLNQYQPGCNVHLFVDTGMNREGITLHDLPAFLTELKQLPNLHLVGLGSHLADGDNPTSQAFVEKQIRQYKKALTLVREHGFDPKWKHIAASSGAYKIRDEVFTMLRVGLALYGIHPLDVQDEYKDNILLQPALEFSSTLGQVKKVLKGELVGYNGTHETQRETVLGLLPAGYYEGVDRRLSNKGHVKIRDQFFPIVGRVSMNMTVIDISELDNPEVGEKVIIYSADASDTNSLVNAAHTAGTISYELMVHISATVKRVVV